MKNSPSALIPFCEYNGDMLAVGEHIENFPFPVCNAFTPEVIDGHMCYTFQPNTTMREDKKTSENPYLMFLLDYNENREYTTLSNEEEKNKDETETFKNMKDNDKNNKEAMIYIHTLGKYLMRTSYSITRKPLS